MKETGSAWQRVEVGAGVSVELPAGAVTRGEHEGVAYAWLAGAGGRFGVWVGPGQGLASWRALFQAAPSLGAPIAAEVCGRPATRQEATFAAGAYAVGASTGSEGVGVVHEATEHPAMTEVALAFVAGDGTPAVATWQVETGVRAAHEAEASRFFDGIRCK